MIASLIRRVFHIKEMIFVFSLTALACLPLALRDLVRDAGVSLLMPLTLLGAILAWAFANWNVRRSIAVYSLAVLGPLALAVRIGQIEVSLFEFMRQLLRLVPAFLDKVLHGSPFDPSVFLSAKEALVLNAGTFLGRLSLWFTAFFRGIQIEDPVVRTFIWSLGLWLIAVWAGWQIFRNKGFMTGILPSTVVLAFVIDYTGEQRVILWLHLALLLFLFGLTNYNILQSRWKDLHIDYSDSTGIDTLALVGALTLGLVSVAFLVSTISIKDILDDYRKTHPGTNESQAQSLGLESVKDSFKVTGFGNGLPRSYLLSAGPEIYTQLAMTISTGDLPPMSRNAHPLVPRYYWRTLTYSIYTGSGWTNPPVSTEDVSADQILIKVSNPKDRLIRAQVTFPNNSTGRLYWTGTLVRANVPFRAAWDHKEDTASLLDNDMLAAVAPVTTYTVESILPGVTARQLRDSPSVYPDWVRKRFLVLPHSVPERVLALARDLTASKPNAYDRALAIQNYLREIPYTLDISTPPAGRDVADYFIFDLKKGYCDYYATSMAVLARAAGLPARLVVGYADGSYDLEKAQYVVTENYAHSWVEIYFAGIGWVEFEPTASEPVIYHEEQNDSTPSVAQSLPPQVSLPEKIFAGFERAFQNAWLLVILLFVSGLLWMGFDSLRLRGISPSRSIQLVYKRLRRLARPVSGYAARNQTAHAYAVSLNHQLSTIEPSNRLRSWLMASHAEINRLTELFSHSLFAPVPPTRAEAKDAIKTWSHLRWRLLLANMLKMKSKQVGT